MISVLRRANVHTSSGRGTIPCLGIRFGAQGVLGMTEISEGDY